MSASVLARYRRITRWPAGHWIFSRLVCLRAPYFATIAPRFVALEPGRCEVHIRDRWRVHNHIGSVHAIALCNLAELSAGVMAEATVPAKLRWIPSGMSVEYLKKAIGTMRAVATPDTTLATISAGQDWPVSVQISNDAGEVVFRARVVMWVSPRKHAGPDAR